MSDLAGLLVPAHEGEPRDAVFARGRDPSDPKAGEVVRGWDGRGDPAAILGASPMAVVVGVPEERGVTAGGGRPGAARGPREIRRAFYRLAASWSGPMRLADLGDVRVDGEAEAGLRLTHARLRRVCEEIAEAGAVPIVLGGGHDLSAASIAGWAAGIDATGRSGVINVDAHLDVRDPDEVGLTSGTPFFRLVAEGIVDGRRYAALGVSRARTALAHAERVQEWGGSVVYSEAFHPASGAAQATDGSHLAKALQTAGAPCALSVDLDCAAQVGVSAPAPAGLAPGELIRIALALGAVDAVGYLDVVEASPGASDPGATAARLGAEVVWYFLEGLSARSLSR